MELLKVVDGDLVLGTGEHGALHVPVVPLTTLLAAHGKVARWAEKISKHLKIEENSVLLKVTIAIASGKEKTNTDWC